MLRIFARVMVAVFVAIAVTAALFVPTVGLVVGAAYLLSAAATAIVRGVVAAMGSLFLVSGLVVTLATERRWVPVRRQGLGGGAGARRLRWVGDAVRGVVALP